MSQTPKITLEELLETCYPVSSGVAKLLTVPELLSLKQVSRRLRDVVLSVKNEDLVFLRSFGIDEAWESRVSLFGITDAQQMPYALDPDGTQKDIFNLVRRLSSSNQRYFRDNWVRVAIESLSTPSCLRRLCLDGVNVSDKFVNMVMTSGNFSGLEELSLVACRQVTLQALADASQSIDERRSKLKKLNIWDIYPLRKFISNGIEAETFRHMWPSFGPELAKNLKLLESRFKLDVALCEDTDTNYWPLEQQLPGRIETRKCMGCSKVQRQAICVACLLRRTCEICQGYYCLKCNPWEDLLFFTPNRESSPANGLETRTRSSVSQSTCYMTGACYHPDTPHWSPAETFHPHYRAHRHHESCGDRLPNPTHCSVCLSELGRGNCRFRDLVCDAGSPNEGAMCSQCALAKAKNESGDEKCDGRCNRFLCASNPSCIDGAVPLML